MTIDALASERHFAEHLAPVWHALPDVLRGRFLVGDPALVAEVARLGIDAAPATTVTGPLLVASYGDLRRGRRLGATRFGYLEHGAGQSYAGDPRTADHPSYAGGRDHDDVALFLVPSEAVADRWRSAYPRARVEVVGSPRVEALPAREPAGDSTVIAVTSHFRCGISPETRPAFDHHRHAVAALARTHTLIGHGHPRDHERLAVAWRRMRMEPVPRFDDVCRRADLLIGDNTSALFEFAATGRPVVVLDAPWYRRDVRHGLRFWDAADVGVRVGRPEDLAGAVTTALADPPERRAERERVVAAVYARPSGGAAAAAADAIAAVLGTTPRSRRATRATEPATAPVAA